MPEQSTPTDPGFLSAYRFHLNAAWISSEDVRFTWEADVGADIDLIDYGVGRVNFLANYNPLLGDEFRPFDVNQGLYTLNIYASVRSRRQELAGVFHHVSRHLSDRFKEESIDWNMAGAQYWHRAESGGLLAEGHARALVTTKRSLVDYKYELGGLLRVVYPRDAPWAVVLTGSGAVMGVEETISTREILRGGRVEGGVRARGKAGVLELFVAFERRIDAHPLDLLPQTWVLVGFKLLGP